jgi:sensor histidine kinase regulating citrate/malate metabolism
MRYLLIGISLCLILLIVAMGLEEFKRVYLKKKERNLERLHRETGDYYSKLQETNQGLRELSVAMEQQRQGLQKMEDCGRNDGKEEQEVLTLTGNSFVDLALSQKWKLAEHKGLSLSLNAENVDGFPLEGMETISLLGNLFDNAVEACEGLSGLDTVSEKEPFIHLQMTGDEKGYMICIENSKHSQLHPIENGFQTTKQDPNNHGNGLLVVETIVKKYNGDIEFEDNGNSFKVIVRL